MEGLTIRKATRGDTHRIAEIVAGTPGDEAIGIIGSRSGARRFGMALIMMPHSFQGWERSVVGELNGETAGVIQAGERAGDFGLTPRIAWIAFRSLGPIGVVRAAYRMRARSRVDTSPPKGAYHIAELHVDPSLRSKGIGGALLDYAEAEARGAGYKQMSLSTTTNNPARHLYERHGFGVVQTRTDPIYERYTGIAGRVLMVKDLA
jgi:ribosomal protein S18 acetylase RimI-like enzyme